jgi:hypothetical protein
MDLQIKKVQTKGKLGTKGKQTTKKLKKIYIQKMEKLRMKNSASDEAKSD